MPEVFRARLLGGKGFRKVKTFRVRRTERGEEVRCFTRALRAGMAGTFFFLLIGSGALNPLFAETVRAQSEVRLSAPRGVFVGGDGNIYIASPGNNSIVLLRERPRLKFEDEVPYASSFEPYCVIVGEKEGRLSRPCDVAVDSAGRVIATDTGNNLVKIYADLADPRRYSVQVIRGGATGRFSSPEGVAVDERGNIIVFDTGNGQIHIFSSELKPLAVLSGGADRPLPDMNQPQSKPRGFLKAPIAGCSFGNGYLVVADRALPTYSVWKYDPVSPRSETCRFVGYGPVIDDVFNFFIRDIAYDPGQGYLAYIGSNFPLKDAAFLYFRTVDGEDLTTLLGGSIPCSLHVPLLGWLDNPSGVAFGPGGHLYIADAASDSVQRINRESFNILNSPVSVEVQRTRAILKYHSTARVPTELEYGSVPPHIGQVGPLEQSSTDPAEVFAHRVQLTGLLPSTRYAFRYRLSSDIFCSIGGKCLPNFSRTRFFATESAPQRIDYLDFPLTVLLFTNLVEETSSSGSPPADVKDPGPLTSEQIKHVRSQLEAARLFFWVNSRMTCNLKPKLVVVNEKLRAPVLPALKTGGGEMRNLDTFLQTLNGLVRKYAGSGPPSSRNVFIVSAVRAYDPQARRFVMRESSPITCGVEETGGGFSLFSYADDSTWRFVQGYQRQLSVMHLNSGKSDSLSCLVESPDSDRSMVLWDSVADLARALGRQGWLSNRYGTLKTTADNDEDGVPDDEPDCPLDEKRFGTSPRARDTDNDGVSDLNEVLFSRWADGFSIEGAKVVENHARPSPSHADTDGDATEDSADSNPLCALRDSIQRLDIAVDGKVGLGEWEKTSPLRIADPRFSGTLRVAWNTKQLCFSLTGVGQGLSLGPPSIRIRLDGAADGFLRGSDNLTLVFEPTGGGSFAMRQEPNALCSAQTEAAVGSAWPDLSQVVSAYTLIQDSLQAEIALPKSLTVGLNLFGGEEIGFDFEIRPAKSPSWLRVFEPLALFRGTLAQPQAEVGMPD